MLVSRRDPIFLILSWRRSESSTGPIFLSLQFLTFCLAYCQSYETMTGPKSFDLLTFLVVRHAQRLLSYLLSSGTCPKPMLFKFTHCLPGIINTGDGKETNRELICRCIKDKQTLIQWQTQKRKQDTELKRDLTQKKEFDTSLCHTLRLKVRHIWLPRCQGLRSTSVRREKVLSETQVPGERAGVDTLKGRLPPVFVELMRHSLPGSRKHWSRNHPSIRPQWSFTVNLCSITLPSRSRFLHQWNLSILPGRQSLQDLPQGYLQSVEATRGKLDHRRGSVHHKVHLLRQHRRLQDVVG